MPTDLQRGLALQRRHLNRASQCSESEFDRDFAEQVVALPLENLVILDMNDNIEGYRPRRQANIRPYDGPAARPILFP